MQAKGIPDTLQEARQIVAQTASFNQHTSIPGHWPHSQIVALAQLVVDLTNRIDGLEAKRKPGRPSKAVEYGVTDAGRVTARVRAELAG